MEDPEDRTILNLSPEIIPNVEVNDQSELRSEFVETVSGTIKSEHHMAAGESRNRTGDDGLSDLIQSTSIIQTKDNSKVADSDTDVHPRLIKQETIGELDQEIEDDQSNINEPEELDISNPNEEDLTEDATEKPIIRRKKRRRIVSISNEGDDSTDDENDDHRSDLANLPRSRSATPTAATPPDITPEAIEAITKQDRPGPRSKKASTLLIKEMQARALLQSAIVIPAAFDQKRRKVRILDSDDDDDDMGNDVLLVPDGGAGLDNIEEDDDADLVNGEIMCMALEVNVNEGDYEQANDDEDTKPDVDHLDENYSDRSSRSSNHRDSGNSSDGGGVGAQHQASTSRAATKLIEKRTSAPERNFDTSDEEYLPNELYFGTPDSSVEAKYRGRGGHSGLSRRGRPPLHSSMPRREMVATQPPRPRGRPRGSGRRGRPPLRTRFVDDRSISSDTTSTNGGSESSSEGRPKVTVKKPTSHAASTSFCVNQPKTIPPKPKTKSRFPDKSSHIPDSIYFGEVDVPLHVLYSYGNTSDESDGEPSRFTYPTNMHYQSRGRGRGRPLGARISAPRTPEKRGRKPACTPSPSPSTSAASLLAHLKKCYKVAGLKRTRFNKLWGDDCPSAQSRADRLMEILRENGLVGEPTISACRQLKKEIVSNEEISELDPNLIIQSEGRTLRQSTRAATHRTYTYDDPDPPIQTPINKFTPILDSDSDSD